MARATEREGHARRAAAIRQKLFVARHPVDPHETWMHAFAKKIDARLEHENRTNLLNTL